MRDGSPDQVAMPLTTEDGWISMNRPGKIRAVRTRDGARIVIVLATDQVGVVVAIHGETGRGL